jgi:putative tryptophan/tyrosine transport system substrate-binding protein
VLKPGLTAPILKLEDCKMRRREFIAGFGGAAAWQLAALAQQPDRMRRVGRLYTFAGNDPIAQARAAAFREGLAQLGWTERNVRIEERFAGGNADRMHAYATELVGSTPDVIVANSTPVLAALKQATRTIPIVFSIVSDPAGQSFVATWGGNITGFSFVEFSMLGKWLEMLKEIAPSVKRTTLVFNPQTAPYYPAFLRDFKAAAETLAAKLSATPVSDEAEIEAAVSAFAGEPGGGLIVALDPFISTHRAMVIALADAPSTPCLLWRSAFRQGRRADLVRAGHARYRPSLGFLRRSRPEGRKAGRVARQPSTSC